MRIIKIIISLFFVLGGGHSCSAQKELQKERCAILKDVFSEEMFKISPHIISKMEIKSRRVVFKKDVYFNIDSLNEIYQNAPEYYLQLELFNNIRSLHSILSNEDLHFMEKQFNNSNNIDSVYFKDCINSLNLHHVDSDKYEIYYDISLPLLSKDKQKCMFFNYGNFKLKSIPDVWICKKVKEKWRLVGLIGGSIDD